MSGMHGKVCVTKALRKALPSSAQIRMLSFLCCSPRGRLSANDRKEMEMSEDWRAVECCVLSFLAAARLAAYVLLGIHGTFLVISDLPSFGILAQSSAKIACPRGRSCHRRREEMKGCGRDLAHIGCRVVLIGARSGPGDTSTQQHMTRTDRRCTATSHSRFKGGSEDEDDEPPSLEEPPSL